MDGSEGLRKQFVGSTPPVHKTSFYERQSLSYGKAI